MPSAELHSRLLAWSQRWLPGWHTLRHYQRDWLMHDALAGLALTAVLIPVGMGYAQACGLPPILGLYASIVPLLVYALMGPSRIMVLGPDSTLVAVIAAVIGPMAAGDVQRAVALSGMLALLGGLCMVGLGLARLGLVADLLSKPIRVGFMNAIALTVLVGQSPKLLGFELDASSFAGRVLALLHGIWHQHVQPVPLALGLGSLALMLALKRWHPHWPGVLIVVVLATALSAALDLEHRAGLAVLGTLPQGMPQPQWPQVHWADVADLLLPALVVALLSFTDTSVLSRALAQRGGYSVDQSQEMVAIGVANIATALVQGFSVSSSASRTPVAEAAGARTQLAGVFGALAIALMLVAAPALLHSLPIACLGAVVIMACLSLVEIQPLRDMARQRRSEFAIAIITLVGVASVGVIQGIGLSLALAMLLLVWNTWHPHYAVLARVDGAKGYHDVQRHPEGRRVPGLVLFRWDAPLFFANAEIFRHQVLKACKQAPTPTRRLVISAEAITDIDLSAADMLIDLHRQLCAQGIEFWFAGLKEGVIDRLRDYGTLARMEPTGFATTTGNAVNRYRMDHAVAWRDWDEPPLPSEGAAPPSDAASPIPSAPSER